VTGAVIAGALGSLAGPAPPELHVLQFRNQARSRPAWVRFRDSLGPGITQQRLHPRAAKPKPFAPLYHLTRTHAQVAHELHYADRTRPIQSARQNFDPRVRWHSTVSTARAVARFAIIRGRITKMTSWR
jgi:hypothetical protein